MPPEPLQQVNGTEAPLQILSEAGGHAVSTSGSTMVTEAVLVHPMASVTVTVYVPTDRFEMLDERELLLHKKLYGPEPPDGDTVTLPSLAPKQVMLDTEDKSTRLFVVTASVLTVLAPQALLAVTVIFPEVAPAVTLIELVTEVPVQPDGSVHV